MEMRLRLMMSRIEDYSNHRHYYDHHLLRHMMLISRSIAVSYKLNII